MHLPVCTIGKRLLLLAILDRSGTTMLRKPSPVQLRVYLNCCARLVNRLVTQWTGALGNTTQTTTMRCLGFLPLNDAGNRVSSGVVEAWPCAAFTAWRLCATVAALIVQPCSLLR